MGSLVASPHLESRTSSPIPSLVAAASCCECTCPVLRPARVRRLHGAWLTYRYYYVVVLPTLCLMLHPRVYRQLGQREGSPLTPVCAHVFSPSSFMVATFVTWSLAGVCVCCVKTATACISDASPRAINSSQTSKFGACGAPRHTRRRSPTNQLEKEHEQRQSMAKKLGTAALAQKHTPILVHARMTYGQCLADFVTITLSLCRRRRSSSPPPHRFLSLIHI